MDTPSTAQVENQAEIDAKSTATLYDSWCVMHRRPRRRYVDGVWSCPECEWDNFLSHMNDLEQHPDYEPDEREI